MRRKVWTPSDVGSKQKSRNQILFREVNERVRDVLAPLLKAGEQAEFLCECGDDACLEAIRLDLEEYEAVRLSPHRFVMVPGHEDGLAEGTVQANGRFVVIDRSALREEAALHDPRRRNT